MHTIKNSNDTFILCPFVSLPPSLDSKLLVYPSLNISYIHRYMFPLLNSYSKLTASAAGNLMKTREIL